MSNKNNTVEIYECIFFKTLHIKFAENKLLYLDKIYKDWYVCGCNCCFKKIDYIFSKCDSSNINTGDLFIAVHKNSTIDDCKGYIGNYNFLLNDGSCVSSDNTSIIVCDFNHINKETHDFYKVEKQIKK